MWNQITVKTEGYGTLSPLTSQRKKARFLDAMNAGSPKSYWWGRKNKNATPC